METYYKNILTITALVFAQIGGMMVIHELTHKQIFQEYGCQNITIGINLAGMYTDAECTKTTDITVTLAQANVESLGYQLLLPTTMITALITISILERREHT